MADVREVPTYTPSEAAHYLRMPVNTLKHWLEGYRYSTKSGSEKSRPLIKAAQIDPLMLSFFNLVEAHVLSALRRKYGVRMKKIRKALDYLQRKSPSAHPFADNWFLTDGIDIFKQRVGELESVSEEGQLAIHDLLIRYLHRIEWDEHKIAARLFPYTSDSLRDEIRLIVIDPRVSFGRPVIKGTGIPTSIIAERFEAGESLEVLVDDYGRTWQEIEEALRCETGRSAA